MADIVSRRWIVTAGLCGGLAMLGGCGVSIDDYDIATVSGQRRTLPPHPQSNPADGVKFLFMPIIGAPVIQGDELYREIRRLMQRDGLGIVHALTEPATYRVKIDLTAVATSTWTTMVYKVFIHDASGAVVHRFGGQIMSGAAAGDPWTGVTTGYLAEAAAQIEGSLLLWLNARR